MRKKIKNIIIISFASIIFIPILFFRPYLFSNKYTKEIESFVIYSNYQLSESEVDFFEKLNKEDIFNVDYSYNIFLTNNENSYIAIVLSSYDSFGVSNTISGNIIIAPNSIEKNEVRRNGEINNSRTLSSVILHECTHRYLNKKYNAFKMLFTETWKEEGYCEYIAQGSSFSLTKGLSLFMHEKEDKSFSFDYFKYRLYVQYLIDYKKMTFDEILDKNFDLEKLEKEVRLNITKGLYILSLK